MSSPDADVSEDELAKLVKKVEDKQRQQTRLVVALVALVFLLSGALAIGGVVMYRRDERRSITLEALQDFAENGNCDNNRTEAFEGLVIVYFSTGDLVTRRAALDDYLQIPPCPTLKIK